MHNKYITFETKAMPVQKKTHNALNLQFYSDMSCNEIVKLKHVKHVRQGQHVKNIPQSGSDHPDPASRMRSCGLVAAGRRFLL